MFPAKNMRRRPTHADHRPGRKERRLVRECEIYLAGAYAEFLDSKDRRVPNWAWLNVLAHSRHDQLCRLSLQSAPSSLFTPSGSWWRALGFLSGEILARATNDDELDFLSRSVLIPLELSYLADGHAPRRPGELVRAVLQALDQRPTSRV